MILIYISSIDYCKLILLINLDIFVSLFASPR